MYDGNRGSSASGLLLLMTFLSVAEANLILGGGTFDHLAEGAYHNVHNESELRGWYSAQSQEVFISSYPSQQGDTMGLYLKSDRKSVVGGKRVVVVVGLRGC